LILNTLVLEQTEHGEMPMDVYQKLANDRILFITDYINDDIATDIIATLLLKDHEDSEKKITLFINSPGGDIRNTFMIYDVMMLINAPIETVCIGAAMDEAAILLAGGKKGMRLATKNSIISVSQLVNNWHMHTNMTDAKNLMEQFKIDNDRLMDIISKASGKSLKQVREDFDRRVFFTASKAMKYGLIDKIVTSNK
jgi:ATP-dependent Clp protease, protease subunit